MTTTQDRYQGTLDTLAALREEFHGTEDVARRAELRPQIKAVKVAMIAAWSAADREWYVSLGPVQVRSVPLAGRGAIALTRASSLGGGRSTYVRPGDPHYAACLALLREQEAQDADVSAAAYAVWGWRGAVRIDYYGDAALVSRGAGTRVRVHLPTMTATAV
jgi:hypothetical protein